MNYLQSIIIAFSIFYSDLSIADRTFTINNKTKGDMNVNIFANEGPNCLNITIGSGTAPLTPSPGCAKYWVSVDIKNVALDQIFPTCKGLVFNPTNKCSGEIDITIEGSSTKCTIKNYNSC